MYTPSPKITTNPATLEILGNFESCTGATEKICYQITRLTKPFNYTGEELFMFLRSIILSIFVRFDVIPYSVSNFIVTRRKPVFHCSG